MSSSFYQDRLQQELQATAAQPEPETRAERYAREAYESAQKHLERVKTTKDAAGQLRASYQDRHAAEQDLEAKRLEMYKVQNEGARERRLAGLEAEKAAAQKKSDQLDEQRRAEIEATVKNQYLVSYLEAGGSPAQFEKNWGEIWQDHLRKEAAKRTSEMEAGMRARFGGFL